MMFSFGGDTRLNFKRIDRAYLGRSDAAPVQRNFRVRDKVELKLLRRFTPA
jgi:hypothetical protein